jgi:hypothetical protein
MVILSRRGRAGVLALIAVLAALSLTAAQADTNQQVAAALVSSNVYVSNALPPSAHVSPGDTAKLNAAVDSAAKQGVTEKIALVSHYPSIYSDTYAAAEGLRKFLDFSGALIMVSPRGIGVASGSLTLNDIRSIEQQARPRCIAVSYTACAVLAAQLAAPRVKAATGSANRNALLFWVVVLAILAVVIGCAVWFAGRRRRQSSVRLDELQTAAGNTLSLADNAVNEIERSGAAMSPEVRAEYDRALALRDGARREIERGTTPGALTQANQDAAQAVLALQGVMKTLGVQSPLANPLETPAEHRCFYCGRTDRPPYTVRTIEDGKGNSMQIEVCAVDMAELERGRTPQVQTVQYQGAAVPWWAVPTSPWYYSYGGPSWQYWLPFLVGMDVGGWFAGGWGGPAYGWGGGFGDVDDVGQQYAGQDISGSTVDPSTDMGAGDFGAWGGGASDWSGGDAGGWGGDAGAADAGAGDWGGDGGGGGWGGGDSGGW